MNIAQQLREITALDLEGRAVTVGQFWQEQPVVLVFVRHYG